MKYKVVLTHFYPDIPVDETIVTRVGANLVQKLCRDEYELLDVAQDADAVAILTTALPLPKSTIVKLSKCRIIANIGVGYENIDINAATEQGICVTYTPDYCLDEVSDHTVALLLAFSKRLVQLSQAVKNGAWDIHRSPTIANITRDINSLRGQTLGLIGLGNIARMVATKAKVFGLKVIAYDPYVSIDIAKKYEVELVALNEVLSEADFISVHAALTKETLHMIGIEQFKIMKPNACFINTARGGLVDNKALYEALTKRYIAFAALDATEPEPLNSDSPLLTLDNVLITPHTAAYSKQALLKLWREPLKEVAHVLKGEWPNPKNFLNPRVKDKYTEIWGN